MEEQLSHLMNEIQSNYVEPQILDEDYEDFDEADMNECFEAGQVEGSQII